MAVNSSSRYTTSVDERTGRAIAVRKSEKNVSFDRYTSRQDDSFDVIAQKLFGNPQEYWRIADLNPQVKFPNVIDVGTVVRIPK
jgi:hypothetical protein